MDSNNLSQLSPETWFSYLSGQSEMIDDDGALEDVPQLLCEPL